MVPWSRFWHSLRCSFTDYLAVFVVFSRYLLLPGAFGLIGGFCGNVRGFGGASYEGEVFWVHSKVLFEKTGVVFKA